MDVSPLSRGNVMAKTMKVYVDVFKNELIVLFLVDQFTVITAIVSTLSFEIIRPYGQ